MGASLAEMRATKQIDAIEALSVDSLKLLVVPSVVGCFIALPLLTTFVGFCGVMSGFLSEHLLSHISLQLYVSRAFRGLEWSNSVPPNMQTTVFGFIIATVSCFFGYRRTMERKAFEEPLQIASSCHRCWSSWRELATELLFSTGEA